MRYRFDDFELDLEAYKLKRGDQVLTLQPKVFDVLRYFVENPGRLISKAQLLDELWKGEYVNDTAVSWSVSHIRRVLGQKRADKRPIETVHGRGYRFTAEVDHCEPSAEPKRAPSLEAPSPSAALIGRERVLARLTRGLRDAAEGRGGLMILTGEAGIGKTRCAQELLRVAAELNVLTLGGRCPHEPGTPPLWPVATALSELSGEYQGFALQARALLQEPPQGTEGAARADSEQTRFHTIAGTAELLQELGNARPVLLFLDDLHWADSSTLRLLAFLGPELGKRPLLIVATQRDDEPHRGGASPARQQLLRYATTLPLTPLDQEQVAALVESLCHERPSPELAQAVRRAASGVPLFIREVVHTLVLEHGESTLATLDPEAVRVPEVARDLLRGRMQHLPAATLSVLSHAAVVGERFDLSLLSRLVELEPEELLDHLESAAAQGQLESDSPHTYRFGHSMFQSVLYDDLPHRKRVAIHRRVGELLASRVDGGSHYGEIARHFYLSLPAGDHEQVAKWALRAGNEAAAVSAFEEAAVYFTWALEAHMFGGTPKPRKRAELLLSLAITQRSAGRTGKAVKIAAEVIDLARQHGMVDLVVAATRLRRPTVAMGILPDPTSRSALEFVLQQTDEQDASRISALSQLAFLPPYEYDLSRSKSLSERAVQLAEKHGDRELRREAYRARMFALSSPDDIDLLLKVSDEMLALDREGPVSWQSGDALTTRYTAYLHAGRISEADAVLDQMSTAIAGARMGESTFFCERLRAQRVFLDGRLSESEDMWNQAFKKAQRAGVSYAPGFRTVHLFNLAVDRDGGASVLPQVEALLAAGSDLQNTTRASLLRVAAYRGRLDLVTKGLPTLGDPETLYRGTGYLRTLADYAVVASSVPDKNRCEQLIDQLSPYATLNTPDVMGYYLGSVSHYLGLLCATLERNSKAAEYFDQALHHNDAMGYRSGVLRTRLAHARLDLRRGRRGAAEQALQQVRTEADSLGMTWAVEASDSLG